MLTYKEVKEPPAKEDPSRTVISEQEVLEREWRNVDAILEADRLRVGLSSDLLGSELVG